MSKHTKKRKPRTIDLDALGLDGFGDERRHLAESFGKDVESQRYKPGDLMETTSNAMISLGTVARCLGGVGRLVSALPEGSGRDQILDAIDCALDQTAVGWLDTAWSNRLATTGHRFTMEAVNGAYFEIVLHGAPGANAEALLAATLKNRQRDRQSD